MAKKRAKKRATSSTPLKRGQKYRTPLWENNFLEMFRKMGDVTAAAEAAGIDRTTVYKRKDACPKFFERFMDALERSIEMVEAVVRHRALVGTKKAIYYKGAVVGYEMVTHDVLAMFYLKANKPEKYREAFDFAKVADAVNRGKTS